MSYGYCENSIVKSVGKLNGVEMVKVNGGGRENGL